MLVLQARQNERGRGGGEQAVGASKVPFYHETCEYLGCHGLGLGRRCREAQSRLAALGVYAIFSESLYHYGYNERVEHGNGEEQQRREKRREKQTRRRW